MTPEVQTVTKFPTHIVLCVASKLIPDSKMLTDVYKLLEHMTGGEVDTKTLTRAMNECHRFLLHRQPQLAMDPAFSAREPLAVQGWFQTMCDKLGDRLEVARN